MNSQRILSARIAAIAMLGLAASITSHGIASANPEKDACGRDTSSGPLPEPCLQNLAGKTAALEAKGLVVVTTAVVAPVAASCGKRSSEACEPDGGSRR